MNSHAEAPACLSGSMTYETDSDGYTLVDSDSHTALESNHVELDDDATTRLASLAEKRRLWWRNALINAAFIASWYVCTHIAEAFTHMRKFRHYLNDSHRFLFATVLSVYNKWMFSPDHFGFPSPLFVTTLHMFVQFILAALLRLIWPRHFRPERNPTPSDYL